MKPDPSMAPPKPASNILVVDDETEVRNLLRKFLETKDYRVQTAANGQEAVDLLETFAPACILLDIRMPHLNGFEALRLIRFHQPDAMVIMVTAMTQVRMVEECMRQGAFGYITKPVDLDYLTKEIQAALDHKATQQERHKVVDEKNLQVAHDLHQNNQKLRDLNARLNEELFEALKLPHDLLASIYAELGIHGKNVSWLCRELGVKLGLSARLCELAGLYHDVGKLSLPARFWKMNSGQMDPKDRELFQKFPQYGEEMIQYHMHLEGVARVLRHQCERVDGKGFPDRLPGNKIPLISKVLAVANRFDEVLMEGNIREIDQVMDRGHLVMEVIKKESGSAFDSMVVEALDQLVQEWRYKTPREREVHLKDLKPKLVLSRNVFSEKGKLIFAQGTRLTLQRIDRLRDFHRLDSGPPTVRVYSS